MRPEIPGVLTLASLAVLAGCAPDRPERTAAPAEAAAAPFLAEAAPAAAEDLPEAADPGRLLLLERLDWGAWEDRPRDAAARLRELGIVPRRRPESPEADLVDGYDLNGERVEDFHFVDFSGDGVPDVIYDGPWFEMTEGELSGLEGTRLTFYQVLQGRAVRVMEHHGSVQRIWRARPGDPVAFRSVHYGCCADPAWSIHFFRPELRGDTVRFVAHHALLGREGLEIPTRFLEKPRRFRVANAGYLLRADPRIDDAVDEEWPRWEGRGNALAEYGAGARGTALAEQTDGTGRVWWFVRMDGLTPPRRAQVAEDPDAGYPADRLGWMSSRFLEPEP